MAKFVPSPGQLRVNGNAEAEGRLRGGARETARTLWAGVHGVVSLMITKPYFPWADRQTLVDTVLDALFAGLPRP